MRGQGWKKWRKWVALAAVAGMLIGQGGVMPVWAAEAQTVETLELAGEEAAESETAEESAAEESLEEAVVTVSGSDMGASEAAYDTGSDEPASGTMETVGGSDAADSEGMEGILTEDQLTVEGTGDLSGSYLSGEIEVNTMTMSEFESKLQEIQNQYQHGSGYTNPWPSGDYDCYGYAHWVADTVFNSNSKEGQGWVEISDLNQVQAGDIVQYGDYWNAYPNESNNWMYSHTIFVTAVIGNEIIYTDANGIIIDNTSYTGKIAWNRSTNKTTNTIAGNVSPFKYILRYEGSNKITEDVAHNIASGKDGNITWVIDVNGKLTVEGTGDLSGNAPARAWRHYSSQITSAVINVTGMTNASWMFADCWKLTSLDVRGFDTSNVTNMNSMFSGCSGLKSLDLSGFDTSNVTNMDWMFCNCSGLTSLDVRGFDTSNVTSMEGMFANCRKLTSLDVRGFDTSNVTDMVKMFFGCSGLKSLDLSDFDTSNVTDMHWMFYGCSGLTSLDVRGFATSNVTNMNSMFYGCSGLTSLDVSGFATSNVTDMGWMFCECSGLTSLDVSGFATSNVTYMGGMFIGCSGLTSLDVRGFDTSNVTSMGSMFSGCSGLTSLDVRGFDTSNVTSMGGMFSGCSGLTSLDVRGFDTSNVTYMVSMFWGCSGLTSLDVRGFDTSNVTDMVQMFYNCSGLTSLDVRGFDTSNVTDMVKMFSGCSGLKSLDLSDFDTSNVTDMGQMFYNCSGLRSLDVRGFDTSNVTDMHWMFHGCGGLTSLDVRGFDTSNVTDMGWMFAHCRELTSLDVRGFDTSNVTNMGGMFNSCSGLTSLAVSGFDTSNVTDMGWMFCNCSGLTSLAVSGFDTSNVTDMGWMFCECSGLTSLDVSGFDTSNVTDMEGMLAGCTNLNNIKTPYIMGTATTDLPATFIDTNGTETPVLSKDFCNTTLTRKKLPKPAPAKFTVVGVIGGRNVTFNTDSEDAVIYYSSKTSNLTTNDTCVKPGETVLFENFYGTIYAKAYANGQWSNVSRLILKIPVVNKPTITCKDGVVTIKTTTPDSYIYYTTDGSTPSPTNGKRLAKSGGSFTVPANCTVKAIAVRSCFTNSEVVSAKATARKLGAPSFAVKGVIGGREVTFNSTEAKGEIYYSFTTSNITTKDLHVKPGEKVLFQNYYGTVYARTYVNGQWSNVSRLILKIPVVNKPTITAAGNGRVKISTSTPNCAIYYTTDGSTPSPTNGKRINSSSSIVTVGSGKTVKAIAVRSCFTNSDVATYR